MAGRKRKVQGHNNHFIIVITAILDFLCLEAALLIGYWLWMTLPWHGNFQHFYEYAIILWIVPPLALLVFHGVGLYKPQMGIMGVAEQSLIFKAIWLVYFAAFAISFFYREIHFSRLATFYSIFIAILFISIERHSMRFVYAWMHHKGLFVQNALIYGGGYHGQRLARWIQQSPKLGIKVLGFLDDNVEKLVRKPVDPPLIGGFEDMKKIVEKEKVSTLFIAHRNLENVDIYQIFELSRKLGVTCWAIPALFHPHIERISFNNIGGIPLVGIREEVAFRLYLRIKNFLDIVVAALLLLILAPLFALIGIGVLLASGRPVFFQQVRIGQARKKFTMYKFRTLKQGGGDAVSPEIGQRGSSAGVNSFSSFLRRSGLDELPQLINVLKGEMSIIGPRPEMPFIVEKYGALERERLRLKPGITGLWQISRDRKRLLIHENMDYDLYYAENISFNLDLAILTKTVFTVLGRLLGIPKNPRRT